MLSLDYYNNHNGLAATQHLQDFLVAYFLTLTFIMFCVFPLFTYFKESIFWTLLHILDNIQCIGLYTMHIFNTLFRLYTILKELWQIQIHNNQFQQPETQKVLTQTPPPLDEFITEVREQLTIFPYVEQTPPIQEIQQECCELQVFEAEQFFSYTPHIFIEHTYAPPVVCNDHAFTEFVQGEERCLKFISQDLTLLQSSIIPSSFNNISNTDGTSANIRESHTQTALLSIRLPTCTPQEHSVNPSTQMVEPVLGFMPADIRRAEAELKLTLEQLLRLESCKEYVQMPIQTLDGIHVHQPCQFLLLAKEAKKLAEALKKEQDACQCVGILHEKLLQESFVEQLNSLQTLKQLAPLKAAKEHLL